MRNKIINSLLNEMKENKNIFFLNADMGINLVEQIQLEFPERYANVGISEQNLIGVAAGLANVGYLPFVYTISNFLIHRCFEQIRNDIILHNYPITLIGTSTGFDNAPLGPTHHMLDDWASLATFPLIDIYCPSSIMYANSLISKVLLNKRPAYIRIPKGNFTNPQSNDDGGLRPSAELKVMVYRGHPEQPTPAEQLEGADLENHRQGLHHEQPTDDDKQQLGVERQRQSCQTCPDRQ